ncbi:MAG: DNA topoisomerase I [Candidatus Bathyarchaeota archaeon]|nr:DNA topoisomerase I [Candidatus Termiticorpusculum sp.]MCL2867989.1 DNA topoisomerase I [Candidatus Termiticorpusculum sp.]
MKKYTLIISEKPDAANRIAVALDDKGKAIRENSNGVPFFVAKNGDKEIIVASAIGHLYTVSGAKKGWFYPVFDYQWVPRWMVKKEFLKNRIWLKVISKLAEDAEEFVDACDYDIEGSIIGYCILKYACNSKEKMARRMKYSTLTREELRESFINLLPQLDFALIEAGLARHEVDWLYGINLSRALTLAVKNSGGIYTTLSAGRVQGPTLKYIETREKNIRIFVPTPFWSITAKISIDNHTFELEYEKKSIATKSNAKVIRAACKVKEGQIIKIDEKKFQQKPPVPFDLGTLQSEAYRLFRYTPMQTAKIAQHLYINALISYPRTSSQKLPPSIDYNNILRKLSKSAMYQKLTQKLLAQPMLKPNEGPKFDPAHPAIYPTGNLPEKVLDTTAKNIYDLIVKRFLAVFGEPALKQSLKVSININQNLFFMMCYHTLKEGWIEYYKSYVNSKDISLPLFFEGQKVVVKKVTLKDNFTKPPPRFNPRSLLKKMEKEEIGTKATRANIIQTLYDRKYLEGKQNMSITDLGFEVTEVLRQHCPRVISSEMTKKLEEKMEQIQLKQETRQNVIAITIENLKNVTETLKQKQLEIGTQLGQKIKQIRFKKQTIGNCPKCQTGTLVIINSKKTGKRFVGCTNFFENKCDTSFPLPQKGAIEPLATPCKTCGYPVIKNLGNPKHPWKMCLNLNCPTKEMKKNEL